MLANRSRTRSRSPLLSSPSNPPRVRSPVSFAFRAVHAGEHLRDERQQLVAAVEPPGAARRRVLISPAAPLAAALPVLVVFLAQAPLAQNQIDRWPSFRGPSASGVGEGVRVPGSWNVKDGRNVRWTTDVPGLAHSSPIVWGDRVFVTTAISSQANATFKPGLYGEGTASEDKSVQRWVVLALDRRTGRVIWKLGSPPLAQQHDPRPLPNGNLLIFDNGAHRRDHPQKLRLGPLARPLRNQSHNPRHGFS